MLIGRYATPFECEFVVEQVAGTSSDRFLNAAVPWVAGDVKVDKDGGGVANITTLPVRIGSTPLYKLNLSATEMTATHINVYLVDADGPTWRDTFLHIRTDVGGWLRTGVAQAGAAGTITLDAAASATTDYYAKTLIRILAGTGAGQARYITTYNGTTKVATVSRNWSTNPSSDSQFVIEAGPDVWDIPQGTEPASTHSAASTFGKILQLLVRAAYNKVTQTASTRSIYDDAGTSVISTCTVSDDGTTQTKGAAS